MIFNDKEIEELLAVNTQANLLVGALTYCDELEEALLDCMKNKTELSREHIQQAHNNYLALCIIGLNYCDREVFKKLDEYMDYKY